MEIPFEDFKKVIAYLFNETFDYDYTEFSIDEETSACLNGDYVFIYKFLFNGINYIWHYFTSF